jgi:hypothetical protein
LKNKDLQIHAACRKCVTNAQFIEEPHIRGTTFSDFVKNGLSCMTKKLINLCFLENFFNVICHEITLSIINDLAYTFQQKQQRQDVLSLYIISIAKALRVLQEKDYQHEESIQQIAHKFDELSSLLFKNLFSQQIPSLHTNFIGL